jgi:hypothetical protein
MPRRSQSAVVECERRYSAKAAAEIVGLSLSTIKHAVADAQRTGGARGPWPLELVGGRVLIPASSLDGWLRRYRT